MQSLFPVKAVSEIFAVIIAIANIGHVGGDFIVTDPNSTVSLVDYINKEKLVNAFDLQELRIAPIELQKATGEIKPRTAFQNLKGQYNRKVIQRRLLGQIYLTRMGTNTSTHLVCIGNTSQPLQGEFEPADPKTEHFWVLLGPDTAVRSNVLRAKTSLRHRRSLCHSMALVCNSTLFDESGKFFYNRLHNILHINDPSLDGYTIYAYSSRDKGRFKHSTFIIQSASGPACRERLSTSSSTRQHFVDHLLYLKGIFIALSFMVFSGYSS